MRINIKYQPLKESIKVRRISWKQRCEEQLDDIIKVMEKIKCDLEGVVNEQNERLC